MDESERWRRNLGRQSSVMDRWPHNADKPSDPSKSSHSLRSSSRRESGSDSQDGSKQEQSYHHTKSKTGELYSDGVSTGIKVVPAHMRTTQSTTRPKTTPCVQEIPQRTPINVTPTPPSWEQTSGNKQQGGGAELGGGWQVVQEKELQVITNCKCKSRNSSIYSIPCRLLYLCLEKTWM